MKANFLDAHERHWDDAERLFAAGRLANADHLYGMATECGLKQLMERFGMEVIPDTGSPVNKEDRIHANSIWVRFESYRCGKAKGAGYALPALNPFDDWNVSDRYAHQSEFDQARVQRHQSGTQNIRTLITKARSEGLL